MQFEDDLERDFDAVPGRAVPVADLQEEIKVLCGQQRIELRSGRRGRTTP